MDEDVTVTNTELEHQENSSLLIEMRDIQDIKCYPEQAFDCILGNLNLEFINCNLMVKVD